MGAGGLATVRDSIAETYQRQLAEKVRHLEAAGLGAGALAALAPETAPFPAKVAALWNHARGRPDALAAIERNMPGLGSELTLWRVERQALRRRVAELTVEIHKKFSLPVACVVFVLVGAPLGMRVRRAGPAVAFLSIAFFVFYWVCLVGGEELAQRSLFPPWLAMWLPNIVLGAIGIDWTLRACEVEVPWRKRRAAPPALGAVGARTAA
jgi:lipopolysaccharide export system permease protein